MKLAQRLTWAILAGLCLILVIEGVWRLHRIEERFEDDMRHDHQLIGQSAGRAIAEAPLVHTWSDALDRITKAFERNGRVRIRWVAAEPPGASGMHGGRFYSYVKLPPDSQVDGVLEVSEPVTEEHAYMRGATIRVVGITVLVAALGAVLAAILGYKMVGSPVKSLVDKARRVGAGDLGAPLQLAQRDELGDLATEMNVMCERLAEAKVRIASETQARVAAIEALRHADRLATVGKLASGMAHEMGTPLNVIAARGKMIELGEGTPEELAGYGRIVVDQTERITRIIRQLLDFARGRTPIAGTAQQPSRRSVDLRKLAEDICVMLAPLAAKRGVSLGVVDGQARASTLADDNLIEQAVTNLVVNAVQASSPQGAVTLELVTEQVSPPADIGGPANWFVGITVRDQGSGIAPENLPRIFEPFFTTKEVGQGTGLGLSVAYGIAREHGGWIAVESNPGKGSRFTMFLPAAIDEGTAQQEYSMGTQG